jgi:hypothetical protein
MSAREQFAAQGFADEAGCTGDENAHDGIRGNLALLAKGDRGF